MAPPKQLQNLSLGVSLRAAISALAMVVAMMAVATPATEAQTLTVLHNFTGGRDGAIPWAGLLMDKAGNLYGTTFQGGAADACDFYGCGTVFKLSKKGSGWIFNTLYTFQGGNDGANPILSRLIFGPNGTLYGATAYGGNGYSECCGTIFNLRPPPRACTTALCPWSETVLYRFTDGSDGGYPTGDVIFDNAGNLYGATSYGGLAGCGFGCGIVYKLAPSGGGWTQSVLYSFTGGNSVGGPRGGVIFDQAGNLYGVAAYGGSGLGTVYELTPSGSGWGEATLFNFQSGGPQYPDGSLIFDQAGDLYGTAYASTGYVGAVYKLTESNGMWGPAAAYYFTAPDEVLQDETLTMDSAGNVYGTALSYNSSDCGIVFKLNSGLSNEVTLYAFSGSKGNGPQGCDPAGSVVFDASGNIYGITSDGGAYGYGVVWEITP